MIVSFGGGVQSHELLAMQVMGQLNADVFVFANVGDLAENPATLEYIEKYTKPFAQKHGIEFVELRKEPAKHQKSDLYLQTIESDRIDIPMRCAGNAAPLRRTCTVDWKIEVIARAYPGQIRALGISTDEIERARNTPETIYPLIDANKRRSDCTSITTVFGLPAPESSECWFCPWKNMNKWIELKKNRPDLFAKAVEIEKLKTAQRLGKGKSAVYLSRQGAQRSLFLDQVVPDQILLFESIEPACESGYCMV